MHIYDRISNFSCQDEKLEIAQPAATEDVGGIWIWVKMSNFQKKIPQNFLPSPEEFSSSSY